MDKQHDKIRFTHGPGSLFQLGVEGGSVVYPILYVFDYGSLGLWNEMFTCEFLCWSDWKKSSPATQGLIRSLEVGLEDQWGWA